MIVFLYGQSARCSCRMRRTRLIRPTEQRKFNRWRLPCRPDKHSASGTLAFVICLKGSHPENLFDYGQSAHCSCRMRRTRLIRPTEQRKFSRWRLPCRPDKRSASGMAFVISLKGSHPENLFDYGQSARCSCRMRRTRLIRPTEQRKFNRWRLPCRPDKRSASGMAFVICLKGSHPENLFD